MSDGKMKVKNDALSAYGDTRGTGAYHRDPKTGTVLTDGTSQRRPSAIQSAAIGGRKDSTTAVGGHKVRAIDLYDREMEPEEWERSHNGHSPELDLDIPKIQAEPYQSKFHTTYEPKTHYRFHDAYGQVIDEEDPLVKQFLEDEREHKLEQAKELEPSQAPAPVQVAPAVEQKPSEKPESPVEQPVEVPKPRSVTPPSKLEPIETPPAVVFQQAPAEKRKKKPRARRQVSAVKVDEVSDEEEKKQFVGWVMNGKKDDLGISERLLFTRRANQKVGGV